jgi:membrane-associated phospholipid phosphatase
MTRHLVTLTAQYLILLPPLVSVGWLVFAAHPRQRRPYLAVLVLGALLSLLLAKLGSALISDPRPFLADGVTAWFPASTDNGFPSDHTLLAAVFAAALWPFHRGLSVCLYVVAVMIGAARVAAGVHHGLDVAGALLIGTLGVAIAKAALEATTLRAPAVDR